MQGELYDYYLRMTRLRDRAKRNLDIISFTKERFARVPAAMQIKVIPKVPGNDDIQFKQAWAEVLATDVETLSSCIEQHLTKLIKNIDEGICVNNKSWTY